MNASYLRLMSIFSLIVMSSFATAKTDACASDDPWLDFVVAARTNEVATYLCLLPHIDIRGFDPQDHWQLTPLHIAAKYNRADLASSLIAEDVDLNAQNAALAPPLKMAIKAGSDDVARILIEAGADVEAPDYAGRSLLFWAVSQGNHDITRMLLEKDANPKQLFGHREPKVTVESFARKTGDRKLIQLFANR